MHNLRIEDMKYAAEVERDVKGKTHRKLIGWGIWGAEGSNLEVKECMVLSSRVGRKTSTSENEGQRQES